MFVLLSVPEEPVILPQQSSDQCDPRPHVPQSAEQAADGPCPLHAAQAGVGVRQQVRRLHWGGLLHESSLVKYFFIVFRGKHGCHTWMTNSGIKSTCVRNSQSKSTQQHTLIPQARPSPWLQRFAKLVKPSQVLLYFIQRKMWVPHVNGKQWNKIYMYKSLRACNNIQLPQALFK